MLNAAKAAMGIIQSLNEFKWDEVCLFILQSLSFLGLSTCEDQKKKVRKVIEMKWKLEICQINGKTKLMKVICLWSKFYFVF
jgi:hypothetical protein